MDQERRALERAAASGDADAEARLLATRVRAGELPEGWLEAAARLGHEPARRALGRWVPFLLPARAPGLADAIGAPLAVRLLTEEQPDALRDVPARFRTHFAAARAWAHDPCPATAAALAAAVTELDVTTLLDELPPEAGGLGPWVLGPADTLLRGPAEVTPDVLADALSSLANVGEARWRAICQRVARWALEPPRAPAPRWPTDDDPRAAWSAAETAPPPPPAAHP